MPRIICDNKVVAHISLPDQPEKTQDAAAWAHEELLNSIKGLAIGWNRKKAGFYLFYCDADWSKITYTYHEEILDAAKHAEYLFKLTKDSWKYN